MTTRLLPKRELETKKASERKVAIDEGITLARKVDKLRETVAFEEVRLKQFREASVAQTKKEIAELVEQKQQVAYDIQKLEQVRANLRTPLDEEWAKVRKERAELEESKELYDLNSRSLSFAQKVYFADTKVLEDREARAVAKDLALDLRGDEIEAIHLDALKVLVDARNNAQATAKTLEVQAREISTREINVLGHERSIESREDFNRQREIELNKRERTINDKYATLLRTEQRIYGKRKKG